MSDHPVGCSDTTARLYTIKQGLHSVAEYTVDFRVLAAECRWNDEALLSAYRCGLSEEVQDPQSQGWSPWRWLGLASQRPSVNSACEGGSVYTAEKEVTSFGTAPHAQKTGLTRGGAPSKLHSSGSEPAYPISLVPCFPHLGSMVSACRCFHRFWCK